MNIFNKNSLNSVGVTTQGELDKDLLSFLSNSLTSETIILTNKYSLIRDFSKYKTVVLIDGIDDILNHLKNIKNKQVVIDAYINSLINFKNNQNILTRSKLIRKFLQKLKIIIDNNNLELILFEQLYTSMTTQYLVGGREIDYLSDSIYYYFSNTKTLRNIKNRYENLKDIDLTDWKKILRKEKLKRLI